MTTAQQRRARAWKAEGDWRALKLRYGGLEKKVKRTVMKMEEKKYSADYLVNDFPSISTTWTEVDYSVIPLGDDIFNQRQGRRIAVTEFFLYGVLQGGAVNGEFDDQFNSIRIVGTFSAVATPMATAGAGIHDIIGKRMDGYQVQKKFLDKYIVLPPVGRDTTGYLPSVRVVKIYKRFKKPIYIDYSQNTGTTPSVRPIVSMISDSTGIPNPGFTIGHIAFMYKEI